MTSYVPLVSVVLATGAVVAAGFAPPAQLKVDVALVNVVATVLDDRGRYVADLLPEDFSVYEDGQRQDIQHFTQSNDLPVSVGVILDTSGSMERKIDTATAAVERFVRQIHPDDDIFLAAFDDGPRLLEDFTDDRERLAAALRRTRVGGATALYDALAMGVDHIRDGRHDKKAILLISDGEDTSSATTFEQAQRYVRESEMLVYSLGIAPETGGPLSERLPGGMPSPPTFPAPGPFPIPLPFPFPNGGPRAGGPRTVPLPGAQRDVLDMGVLESFATISGGRTWLVSGGSDSRRNQISQALDELADELRNQYSIGYYPPHALDDGQWHRIEIVTRDPRYRVRVRGDYYGGTDSR